jgi:hypothetical protein
MDSLLYQSLNSEKLTSNGIIMPELFIFLKNLEKSSQELNCDERQNRVKILKQFKHLVMKDTFDLKTDSKNPDYAKKVVLNAIDVYLHDVEYDNTFKYMCGFGILIIILLLGSIAYLLYDKKN